MVAAKTYDARIRDANPYLSWGRVDVDRVALQVGETSSDLRLTPAPDRGLCRLYSGHDLHRDGHQVSQLGDEWSLIGSWHRTLGSEPHRLHAQLPVDWS